MRKMIALHATVALMLFGGARPHLPIAMHHRRTPPCDAGNAGEHNPNCDEEANFTPGTPGQSDRDDQATEEDLTEDDGAHADANVEEDAAEDDAADADAAVEEDLTEDDGQTSAPSDTRAVRRTMTDRHTAHSVLARFADMKAARRGIAALERAGIPGSDIRLEGRAALEAAGQSDTSTSDKAFVHEVDRTVVTGAAIGAGAGGLVGLVAGLLVLGPSWPAIVLPVAGGVAGGGGLGLVLKPIVGLPQTDAAELTYHAVDTMDVFVTVRTNDRHDAGKAAACLRRTNAVSVEQQDVNGTPLNT